MKTNRKGFTITELVIVIVVIAILAAVLIPTFVSLINKANIAADTQLAKNLNTSLSMAEASGEEIDEFSEVLSAARDAGYIISNLNPTAEGCYFVWESQTNQILLVDGGDNYKAIYAMEKDYPAIGETWYFAIANAEDRAKLKADLAAKGYAANIMDMVASVSDLKDMLASDDISEVYIDESLVLDDENILKIEKDMTIDLGSASLNTNGILNGTSPLTIESGANVIINGGVLDMAGSGVDADGDVIAQVLFTEKGTNTVFNNTSIKLPANAGGAYPLLQGDTKFENVTVDAGKDGFVYISGKSKVTFVNTNITSDGRCVWACDGYHDNAADKCVLTIESGNYHGGNDTAAKHAPLASCGGKIVVKGGTFTSNVAKFFYIANGGSIELSGGTFGGKTLSELGVNGLKAMCAGDYNVTVSGGVYTITAG